MGIFDDFEMTDIDGLADTKRAGIVHVGRGDFFAAQNFHAGTNGGEGTWDQWCQIALSILQHPATQVVRPEAWEAVQGLANTSYYGLDEGLELSDEQVARFFPAEEDEEDGE